MLLFLPDLETLSPLESSLVPWGSLKGGRKEPGAKVLGLVPGFSGALSGAPFPF